MVRFVSALSTTTAIGICCFAPGSAWAQCAPNPTQASATTTCTGTDSGTLVANSYGSTVNVQAGASVGSIYATTTASPGAYYSENYISIADNGQIGGGLTVDSGAILPGNNVPTSTSVSLSVGANASIGGSAAISLIAHSAQYTSGIALLTLYNQGTIQSTSGPAITGNGSAYAQVSNLINDVGGQIGGIRAIVNSLTNVGAITGGSGSAIDTMTTDTTYVSMNWQNRGSITSNGSAPTINSVSTSLSLTNSGQITNSGAGTAIVVQQDSNYYNSTIVNQVGGTITSAGGDAITSNSTLLITNAGTISAAGYAINANGQLVLTSTGAINGAVAAGNVGGYGGASSVNLSGGGSINGSLTLAATTQGYNSYSGNALTVDYAGGANLLSSISGTVNIGGTNNALFLNLAGSMTLNAPFIVPTAFSTLGLDLAAASTVTLASGFAASTGLSLSTVAPSYEPTSGTLINNANFTTTGAALSDFPNSDVTIVNTGTIVANLGSAPAGTYTVTAQALYGTLALTNSGIITGNGGNGANVNGGANNTGTIAADGTALAISNGVLTNSGTIAGGNTGLSLFGGTGTNTGTITGGQIGAALQSTTLTNSGTITASGGVAIGLDAYDSLINQQGGVINGGIGTPASNGYAFSNSVSNAGTINGDVNLGYYTYGVSNNTYTELAGGVLNGNLNLGSGGDKLVVALGASGSGAYPGITGTVTGSGTETLVSLVTADSTAALNVASGVFSVYGYDLANNATLTLSSAAASSASYTFAGTGTVNLTANITGTGASTLLNLSTFSVQTLGTGQVPTALNFTSNGNLTVTSGANVYSPSAAVTLGNGSSFTNNGTIFFNNNTPTVAGYYYTPIAAISNGGTFVNNGTISVGGIAAVDTGYSPFATVVVNAGTINQIAGAADASGIVDNTNVTNSGAIAMGGNAVEFSPGYISQLTNSGTITSTDGIAITSDPSGYTAAIATITNMAGGVIGGGTSQPAIALGGGSAVINSGTINGDVQLGLASYYGYTGSTYIANGGTLNGNLIFGGGSNTLLVVGNSTGITGAITASAGSNNLYAQAYSASASIDLSGQQLPTGFQNLGIGAVGSGTVITVTGPSGGFNSGLTLFGDGTVINSANVNASAAGDGANLVRLGGNLNTLLGLTGGLTFINSGNLADGLAGMAQFVTNSGTIGSQGLSTIYGDAVGLAPAAGQPFQFGNSGQILGGVSIYDSDTAVSTSATIQNSGTITGILYSQNDSDQVTFTNSGAMNMVQLQTSGSQSGPTVPATSAFLDATNTATGSISGGLFVYTSSPNVAVINAGTISGGLTIIQDPAAELTPVDQASVSFVNSGEIAGAVSVSASAANVAITNSGNAVASDYGSGGVFLSNMTLGNNTVAFTNSGSIVLGSSGQSGVMINSIAGDSTAPASTAVTVTNSGTIAANGGGVYSPFFLDQTIVAGLAISASAPGGSASVTISNAAGATISANGANAASEGEYGVGALPASAVNGGSIALLAQANTVTLTNAGTITGGTDTVRSNVYLGLAGPVQLPSVLNTLAGAIDVVADTASVTNTGTITGNSIIYATNAAFTNYGTVNGDITLGNGNGAGAGTGTAGFVEGINATVTGTVTGTAATNTLAIDITGGGTLSASLLAQFVGFSDPHLIGSGTLSLNGPLALQTLVLDNAALTLAAGQVLQTAGPIALAGGIGTNSFVNYGTVDGAIVNIDTINGPGGIINIATTASTSGSFVNADASAQLNINGGTVTFTQALTNSGTIAVADGATLVAAGIVNNQSGVITVQSGGTIEDALVNAGTVNNRGTYNADITNQAGATFTTSGTVTAPDAINNAGVFTATGGTISTPVFNNESGGTLAGSPAFVTAGGTLLINQGTISGNVTFGAGANELLLGSGSQISGTVTGGSGSNLLAIMSSATDAAPDQFNLTGVTGFQQSQMLTGSVALSGMYTTGTFAVLGGHLTGSKGSILNAGTVTVATGAVFGSAGTVNANIVVNGTLAPVATMTVNGNVALASGSNALFATTNGQTAKLAVAGQVNIGTGATLTVTAARQGSLLTLITASGGITGSFANANLPASFDILRTGTMLEVYAPFVADAGFHNGAAAALGTINTLVISGRANAALLTSLPVLDSAQGLADATKFARLTPEPYATATQIGIDNGLQITNALRDFDHDSVQSAGNGRARLFTFAQGLGNWTHASGNFATGSSNASNATGGLLGGVGWRGDHAMITVFGGGIHGQQTIAALGASTLAHSSVVGANALGWIGGLDASAMIAYNNGSGATTRALPDGTNAWGRYGLNTMVADVTVGYAIQGLSDWTIHPQIGLTHIVTHRDASQELGSTAFALDVHSERRKLDFVDGALRIAPPVTTQSRFAPWASLGFRVRLGSDNPQAVAFLPDAADAITASGVLRARTVATGKVGLSYALSHAVTLYGAFDGEVGSGGNDKAVNGGLRVSF